MAPVRLSYNPIHLLCIHVSTVFVLNYSGERPSSNVNLFMYLVLSIHEEIDV